MGVEGGKNIVEDLGNQLLNKTTESGKIFEKINFSKIFTEWISNFSSGMKEFWASITEAFGSTTKETNTLNRDINLDTLAPLDITKLEELGRSGPEGVKSMLKIIAGKFGIPEDIYITLIGKESSYDIYAKNPNSSAYSLSQMIDGTWKTYGKGLERDNPVHQATAAAKYLIAIRKKNNCTWEEATAYYNTGENFPAHGQQLVGIKYIKGNLKSIAWKVPGAYGKTPEELASWMTQEQYFKGAASYYSGKKYENVS